jgi:hypothetical protein
MWMDEDQMFELWPDFNPEEHTIADNDFETFSDRPNWIMSNGANRKRYRIAYEFFMKDGKWWMCIFTKGGYLVNPQVSPFLDDEGEPCCIIELLGAYIDRENNRYGEVASFLDQQDEINHRRSKALHTLSSRQTFGRKGEQKDVAAIKRELKKPDGHVEFLGEEFGKDFGLLSTGDMAKGQFDLYMDAKSELDSVSFNAQLAGERQNGDLSGKAIDRLQQAGTIELNSLYNALNSWEKRIYRQIWARIKQFWTEEKWIRVTDDQKDLRWVGLNSQITMRELLQETAEDKSKPEEMQLGAKAVLQQMVQANDQRLDQVVDVKNPVPEIDVDIILDQSYDVINIEQEQFEMLAKFGQGQDIDITELIELSQLRNKDELIEKINQRREAMAETNGNLQQVETAFKISQTKLNEAKAQAELAKVQNPTAESDYQRERDDKDRASKESTEVFKAILSHKSDIKRAEMSAKPTAMIQVDGKDEISRMADNVQNSMAGLPALIESLPVVVHALAASAQASTEAVQNVAKVATEIAKTAKQPKGTMKLTVKKTPDGSYVGETQPVA